jgi:hypothetical protein
VGIAHDFLHRPKLQREPVREFNAEGECEYCRIWTFIRHSLE